MNKIFKSGGASLLLATAALTAPVALFAQQEQPAEGEIGTTVTGMPPADLTGLTAGPDIVGFISARNSEKIRVVTADGNNTDLYLSEGTKVKGSAGLFGSGAKFTTQSLSNGLPVTAKTVQWGGGLVATQIKFRKGDMKTATMIRTGTEQGFAEQTAATAALRGRVGDINQYNIKGTTNVNFDTGKAVLSEQGKADLCAAANSAGGMNNALLLVVGYTDSTGSQEFNQELSEKRASRVVNHLQQACGWKPYRMMTPTGMAEADPLADNETPEGKAQNRRVAVNILVSKAVDGM
ncbi:MAG TPA: OmpA family protein [Sphingorhabdus sp.]|nr:OmpA family protein [Sphingorhabdus sp.]